MSREVSSASLLNQAPQWADRDDKKGSLRLVLILIYNYVHTHKSEQGCGSLFSHLLGSWVSFQATPFKIPYFYEYESQPGVIHMQHSGFVFP